MKHFFITGTDTEVGKTWFTVSLMVALKKRGFDVMGMKPIATGAKIIDNKLVNEDAELIMKHCSKKTSYNLINPFVYELPAAPSIAANYESTRIDQDQIIENYNNLRSISDVMVVEGLGGWRAPITDKSLLSDIALRLNIPIIMVVGMKLGCINHAILTADAIRGDGLNLYGWVSNNLDTVYSTSTETIKTLKKRLNCPHIANFSFMANFDPDKLSTEISTSFISGI